MAFTIGELFVNLRANFAQFKTDFTGATDHANRESSRMSQHFRVQTRSANEGLELLSEGLGVRLPRNIRRLIAESSLLGPAFSAAFGIGAAVGIAGLIADLAPKIAAGASELGGFTAEMKKADEAAHDLNQKLLIGFKTPQEGVQRLSDVNAAIVKGTGFIEQQRKLLDSNTGILDDHWAGYKRLNQAEKDLAANIDLRNKLLEHGVDLTTKQRNETTEANEKLSLAGKSGRDAQLQEIKNLEARRELERDMHAVAIIDTQIEATKIQMRADAIKEGTEAARKFFDEIRSNSKTVQDLFAGATTKGADPFTKIALDADAESQKVADAIGKINKAAEEHPRLAAKSMREIVAARFAAARAEVLIEENKNAELLKTEQEYTAQITKDLRALAAPIPDLALPISQMPILNPEFLNAGRNAIREATKDISTLRDVTLGYLTDVMTPQEQYAVTLENLQNAYEAQLISLDQVNTLAKQLSPTFQNIRNAADQMGQSITQSLVSVVTHSASAREALAGVLQSIAQIIAQMALANLQTGASGLFTKILGGIFGSFGGAGFGSTVGRNILPTGFGIGSDVHAFAQGGSFMPGETLLVGEHEPEIMTMGLGGSITPASKLGGGEINNFYDFRGADAGTELRLRQMIADSEKRSVAKSVVAVRENNFRAG